MSDKQPHTRGGEGLGPALMLQPPLDCRSLGLSPCRPGPAGARPRSWSATAPCAGPAPVERKEREGAGSGELVSRRRTHEGRSLEREHGAGGGHACGRRRRRRGVCVGVGGPAADGIPGPSGRQRGSGASWRSQEPALLDQLRNAPRHPLTARTSSCRIRRCVALAVSTCSGGQSTGQAGHVGRCRLNRRSTAWRPPPRFSCLPLPALLPAAPHPEHQVGHVPVVRRLLKVLVIMAVVVAAVGPAEGGGVQGEGCRRKRRRGGGDGARVARVDLRRPCRRGD